MISSQRWTSTNLPPSNRYSPGESIGFYPFLLALLWGDSPQTLTSFAERFPMRMLHPFCRLFLILATLCSASLLSAKVVWLVGKGAPIDAPTVAQELSTMLKGEEVKVVEYTWLSAWVNALDTDGSRAELLKADTLLVTRSATESDHLTFLGLATLREIRPLHLPEIKLVAVQKPVYRMSGLCNNPRLQQTARLAIGANIDFIALPKVWQRVYTDDTFYNNKVPKSATTENYIAAAGIARALRGQDFEIAPLGGIHADLAEDLLESINKGLDLCEDVLFAANHLPIGGYNIRVGKSFDAILYDGDFERCIGEWLERFAAADGRKLTLHYTKDTTINTGWPCLFRSVHTLGKMPKATIYTRPAFEDNTGRTELQHLEAIYKMDAHKGNWIPFPLAIAEWNRRYPEMPVYQGAIPTQHTAAMFAAMLYLRWTGATVLPFNCDQPTSNAISIGLDVMLRYQVMRRNVNAILCRALDEDSFAFSLWRQPTEKVVVRFDTSDETKKASERKIVFTKNNFWTPQTVSVDQPCIFYWKIAAKQFPGQNTGARIIGELPMPPEEPETPAEEDLPPEALAPAEEVGLPAEATAPAEAEVAPATETPAETCEGGQCAVPPEADAEPAEAEEACEGGQCAVPTEADAEPAEAAEACEGGQCAVPEVAAPVASTPVFSEKTFAPSTVPSAPDCVQLEVVKPRGEHDLHQAMENAKTQNKFLLIQYGRENCTNCQKVWNMLGDGRIPLPEDFLYADVSVDDPETRAIFEETFSVTDDGRYYPFLVVMGPDGSQLAFRSGLGTPEEYNAMMKTARDDYNTWQP